MSKLKAGSKQGNLPKENKACPEQLNLGKESASAGIACSRMN